MENIFEGVINRLDIINIRLNELGKETYLQTEMQREKKMVKRNPPKQNTQELWTIPKCVRNC